MKLKNFKKLKPGDKVVVKDDNLGVFKPGEVVEFLKFNTLTDNLGRFFNRHRNSALYNHEVRKIKVGDKVKDDA